jgi:nitroimidazol reductase NimA-like FMN-containing flavoprotein (pyridoxamine 5'-phosphate oxidase superfamily)
MTDAEPALQELSHEACLELLATQEIGRLGVNAEHYPMIFPVNYALDQATVVFRTRPGTKLSATGHANVTFEVDQIDPVRRTGWSVLVCGSAEELTSDPARRRPPDARLPRPALGTG